MKMFNLVIVFLLITPTLFAKNQVGLEEAVDNFAKELTSRLHGNETIAVIGFKTDKNDLMITFFDIMIAKILEYDRNAVIVERHRIENILKEQNLSLTGLISDESAQRIGHLLGADTVIYGELISEARKNEYKMTIRAAKTESGRIILSPKPYNVRIGHNPYFWSVGIFAGTAFTKPLLIGAIRGTLAPFQHSFMELGLDLGTVSGKPDVDYYSVYPYANYAYFLPFDKGGWYIGTGIGYLWSMESSADLIYRSSIIAMNLITGFNVANVFDISYTLRTNFESVGSKFSVGYTYRFQ